jgi:Glycosyltransferase family 10 (fucosyltransferase) C-term
MIQHVIMTFVIGFDLCDETNEDVIRSIHQLANANLELGNKSVIFSFASANLPQELKRIFDQFTFIQYEDSPRFDLQCMEKHVKMIFRQCSKQFNILPLATPLFIVGERNKDVRGMDLNEWKGIIKDSNLSAIFKEKVIDQMIDVIPTIGYDTNSGFSVVAVGSYDQDHISLIRCDPLRVENLPKIKLICNWTSSDQLLKDWFHMLRGTIWESKYQWITSGEPDYWIIINAPPSGEHFIPSKSIVYRMEPYIDSIPTYNNWLGANLKTDFLFFLDHAHFRNNTEWWLKSNLNPHPKKDKLISAVVSSRYDMEGHKLRIDFIKYIQDHSNLAIDVYGIENKHGLKDWKGSLPEREKDAGLMPYKYHLAVENSDIVNYATEKFWDGLLSECLVFYWGCSGLEEHVDGRAFIRLDLNDKEGSLKTIQTTIVNNEYEKRIEIIRYEKERVRSLYHCFARTSCLIDSKQIHFTQIIRSRDSMQAIPGILLEHRILELRMDINSIQRLLVNYMLPAISMDELTRMIEHKKLWEQTARSNRTHCIIDGKAGNNFSDRITEILAYQEVAKLECDIIFLYSAARINKKLNDKSGINIGLKCVIELLNSHLMNNAELQSDGQRVCIPTQSSCGYIISPGGAIKLINFVNAYGFIMPLDSLFMMCSSFVPDLHSFIFDRNIVMMMEQNIASPNIRILRKDQSGNWTNGMYQFDPKRMGQISEIQLAIEK